MKKRIISVVMKKRIISLLSSTCSYCSNRAMRFG